MEIKNRHEKAVEIDGSENPDDERRTRASSQFDSSVSNAATYSPTSAQEHIIPPLPPIPSKRFPVPPLPPLPPLPPVPPLAPVPLNKRRRRLPSIPRLRDASREEPRTMQQVIAAEQPPAAGRRESLSPLNIPTSSVEAGNTGSAESTVRQRSSSPWTGSDGRSLRSASTLPPPYFEYE